MRNHRLGRSGVIVMLAGLMLVGCGREPAAPSAPRRGGTPETRPFATPPKAALPMAYALIKTFEPKVEQARGIAVGEDGRLYVAGLNGVGVYDAELKPVRTLETGGAARCVAADAEGRVTVGLRTEVKVFDRSGKAVGSWGKAGSGRGEFSVITAIAVSGTNVFVADAGNRCVYRFDATGDFIDEIGKRDIEEGIVGLVCPSAYLDCQVDGEGVVHVTNPGRQRVERYKADGAFLGAWGRAGTTVEAFVGCCNPINIALLPGGRTATAEKTVPRVKVYDRAGRLLALIGSERFTPGVVGLDLAVDAEGRLYVLDPGDGKVKVFAAGE